MAVNRAHRWILATMVATGCALGAAPAEPGLAALETAFRHPPREAGVRCWWWWLNSNVTPEAITRDLEAMHAKGFSGAMIFDAGTELGWGPDRNVPNGPQFGGAEWTELYLHALREAAVEGSPWRRRPRASRRPPTRR